MACNLTLYLSLLTLLITFTPLLEVNVEDEVSYSFNHIDLLRRAMTHASFSKENNRTLTIPGAHTISTTVSLRYLTTDIDISSKVLNNKISELSNVDSCASDGMRLGLHKVVRVSHKTNSTSPAIVCGAFRPMFGAVAVDAGESDVAGDVYWNVQTPNGGVDA